MHEICPLRRPPWARTALSVVKLGIPHHRGIQLPKANHNVSRPRRPSHSPNSALVTGRHTNALLHPRSSISLKSHQRSTSPMLILEPESVLPMPIEVNRKASSHTIESIRSLGQSRPSRPPSSAERRHWRADHQGSGRPEGPGSRV